MGKVPPATDYDSGMKGREEGRVPCVLITTLSRLDHGLAYLKKKRI